MPLFLIGFFTVIGNMVFSAIVWFLTRKGLLFTALAAVIAIIGTLINFLVSQLDGFIGSVIPSSANFVAPFIPDNMSFCLSVIVSAHLACTGYRLTMKFIHWKSTFMLA
jgi:hypothetical protein